MRDHRAPCGHRKALRPDQTGSQQTISSIVATIFPAVASILAVVAPVIPALIAIIASVVPAVLAKFAAIFATLRSVVAVPVAVMVMIV
ncbi:MAG: hypothetical protein IT450_22770 [Phycisphaerales bacterium]|nr:hypothetical protein [Phycisphaerales bacterium]